MKYNSNIQNKLFNYFRQTLSLKLSTKGYYRGDCPNCGGKYTFGINFTNNNVKCFKECGIAKNPLKLLMQLENIETYKDAYAFLNIQKEYEQYLGVMEKDIVERKEVNLPDGFNLISIGNSVISKTARKYLKSRGFRITSLASSGIGYCDEGEYFGYIIFPFYSRGDLKFFQGRRFMRIGTKMKNPKTEDFNIGKGQLIYNEDALFIYNKLYLVESITNALTLGDRSIAILGKTLSSYQLSRIIKSPIEELVILLDDDALENACNIAMSLCNYKRVKLVQMPKGKDVNDLGKNETLKIIKDFKYRDYNYFLKLKNSISLNI